jgi:hypothetical protein
MWLHDILLANGQRHVSMISHDAERLDNLADMGMFER